MRFGGLETIGLERLRRKIIAVNIPKRFLGLEIGSDALKPLKTQLCVNKSANEVVQISVVELGLLLFFYRK